MGIVLFGCEQYVCFPFFWEPFTTCLEQLEDWIEELTSAHNALVMANGGEDGNERFKSIEMVVERLTRQALRERFLRKLANMPDASLYCIQIHLLILIFNVEHI